MAGREVFWVPSQAPITLYLTLGRISIEDVFLSNWVRTVRAAWEDQRPATGPDGSGNSALPVACWSSIRTATESLVSMFSVKRLNVSLWILIRKGNWKVSTLYFMLLSVIFQLICRTGFSMWFFRFGPISQRTPKDLCYQTASIFNIDFFSCLTLEIWQLKVWVHGFTEVFFF